MGPVLRGELAPLLGGVGVGDVEHADARPLAAFLAPHLEELGIGARGDDPVAERARQGRGLRPDRGWLARVLRPAATSCLRSVRFWLDSAR